MNNIILTWFEFWAKKKITFLVIFTSVIVGLIYLSKSLVVYQDITKTLPNSKEFNEFKSLIESKGLNNRFVLSVKGNEDVSLDELTVFADSIISELTLKSEGKIFDLAYEINDDEGTILETYFNSIPQFFTEKNRQDLIKKINQDSLQNILNRNHQSLFSAKSFFTKDLIFKDPLGLLNPSLQNLNLLRSNFNSTVEDGLLLTPNAEALLLVGKCDVSIKDTETMLKLLDVLEHLKQSYKIQNIQVDYFSGFLVAAENARQVKKDMWLTVGLTISAIILILLIYYRNFFIPIFFIIPAVVGMLLSLAVITLIKGEISGISVGAGAIIIGIIMDYSFHFFSHLKHVGSIQKSIKDVSIPLITGSFTTVLAFVALLFTNSVILQDFGWFASISLVGAMFTVLFVLPIIVPQNLFKKSIEEVHSKSSNKFKKFSLYIGIAIVGVTAFSITKIDEFEFESDLDSLNYHPQYLKDSEQLLFGKDPVNEKRIFVFAENENKEEALKVNASVFDTLKNLHLNHEIGAFVGSGFYQISDKTKEENIERWKLFWDENQNRVFSQLDSFGLKNDYTDDAFKPFKSLVQLPQTNVDFDEIELNKSLNESLIDSSNGVYTYVSSFLIDKDNREEVKAKLMSIPGVKIFDNNSLTTELVGLVSDDFNYILWVSSGLVFIVLLIIYGRIELALATFLPMVISWLWIIGLTVLFGVKFNFVNIIITTFIFGLGDDFAIFISDAYLSKYKTGEDKMASYKKSILLSSLTTIIGTGVLYFAKHPAINSIGLLSVLGMISIVIISFTVQPFIYKTFLLNRLEKGKAPVTFFGFVLSVIAFSFFLFGCISLFLIHLVFRIIPFGQKQLKKLFHLMLQGFAWSQVHVMVNVKKQIINKEKLDFSKPHVIIANHQSFIDILTVLALNHKVVIMTNDWVYNSPFFGLQIRYAGFLQASKGIDSNLEEIEKLVQDGYSIVIFPEGTRSKKGEIKRFHKGAFYLSQKLKLDIIPLLLHGFNDTMEKDDFLLKSGQISIKVLDKIKYDDASWGDTYQAISKKVTKFYRKEFLKLDEELKTANYLFPKIISNYLFKGPELEWYVRIKWLFERKNYEYYYDLIKGSKKVYDIGCGLGYMSYFFKFKNPELQIIGTDYDEEKIEIANNNYSKEEGINFIAADINDLKIEKADAIFCMDVLHYLTAEQQDNVLQKCANAVNENGYLIIRDGVSDYNERHEKTQLTEKYSTKIVKFNKAVNDLHFFNKDYISKFAEVNGFSCDIKEQSDKTSNILFVLKKR